MAEEYKARYKGVVGTARLIGESAARYARNAITRNSGLTGQAARTLRGRDDELHRKIEEIDQQHTK